MPFDGIPGQGTSAEEIRCSDEMLVRLEAFFDGGRKWHQGELHDGCGKYCLIGAIDHLHCHNLTLRYLARVARARHTHCPFGNPVLATMNDYCRDFEELRGCL